MEQQMYNYHLVWKDKKALPEMINAKDFYEAISLSKFVSGNNLLKQLYKSEILFYHVLAELEYYEKH